MRIRAPDFENLKPNGSRSRPLFRGDTLPTIRAPRALTHQSPTPMPLLFRASMAATPSQLCAAPRSQKAAPVRLPSLPASLPWPPSQPLTAPHCPFSALRRPRSTATLVVNSAHPRKEPGRVGSHDALTMPYLVKKEGKKEGEIYYLMHE